MLYISNKREAQEISTPPSVPNNTQILTHERKKKLVQGHQVIAVYWCGSMYFT